MISDVDARRRYRAGHCYLCEIQGVRRAQGGFFLSQKFASCWVLQFLGALVDTTEISVHVTNAALSTALITLSRPRKMGWPGPFVTLDMPVGS